MEIDRSILKFQSLTINMINRVYVIYFHLQIFAKKKLQIFISFYLFYSKLKKFSSWISWKSRALSQDCENFQIKNCNLKLLNSKLRIFMLSTWNNSKLTFFIPSSLQAKYVSSFIWLISRHLVYLMLQNLHKTWRELTSG